MSRRVLAIGTNHITTQEMRSGKDYLIRMKAKCALAFVVDGNHINSFIAVRISRNNLASRETESHFRFRFLVKMRDQTAVAFGPRHQRSRFSAGVSHTRSEIKESGPRTCLIKRQSVVVTTSVI